MSLRINLEAIAGGWRNEEKGERPVEENNLEGKGKEMGIYRAANEEEGLGF